MSFSFVNCIACDRQWSQDDRKGHEWWPLHDQDIQRWCCYRCISRAWRNSKSAANIGPCPPTVAEALQTDEFQNEIRYLLEQHKKDYDIGRQLHDSDGDAEPSPPLEVPNQWNTSDTDTDVQPMELD